MIDRDQKCPRCGAHLPVLMVRKPIIRTHKNHEQVIPFQEITGYEEVEELGECVRCTGSY